MEEKRWNDVAGENEDRTHPVKVPLLSEYPPLLLAVALPSNNCALTFYLFSSLSQPVTCPAFTGVLSQNLNSDLSAIIASVAKNVHTRYSPSLGPHTNNNTFPVTTVRKMLPFGVRFFSLEGED